MYIILGHFFFQIKIGLKLIKNKGLETCKKKEIQLYKMRKKTKLLREKIRREFELEIIVYFNDKNVNQNKLSILSFLIP